jgi:Outer membrane protein/protective antigen OMA87
MSLRQIACNYLFVLLAIWLLGSGCSTTRNLKEGEYLLRSNTIKLKSNRSITRKGELKDNLSSLVIQKPNTYSFFGLIPYKLYLYNYRYKKFSQDTTNFQLQSKTVERPVVYDSSTKKKSAIMMKGYLFQEGYFYADVKDTTIYKGKKAYVTYKIETGTNYLINKVHTDIPDSIMNSILNSNMQETYLKNGEEFTYPLIEYERSRITNVLRNQGYYKFNNEFISFEIDTLEKQFARDDENTFEEALNLLAFQKNQKRPLLNIKISIRSDEDPTVFDRYGINRVRVFPDFISREDVRDSSLIEKESEGMVFRYHDYYVRENVLQKHIFLEKDKYYSQSDYDLTISKLNELGIFQSVRIFISEDSTRKGWLNCTVLMTPGKKLDVNANLEGSTGTTYAAGSAATFSMRNRNVGKGANMLTTTLRGGVEFRYDTLGSNFFDHFKLLTRSAGVNSNLDLPKFVIPFKIKGISKKNTPRTIIGAGISLLDRVNYFTLINTSASLTYKWKETKTKTWEVSPAFVNDIRVFNISDSFAKRLAQNSFLRNSYKQTFIEGENIAFTFSDKDRKFGKNYSYLKLGVEEAGGLMSGIISATKNKNTEFSQYVKFDFDAQHFFTLQHSTFAFRFYGGIGLPYGQSTTLPYIKQYFVGGAYSIRGWRIRQLGPGSYVDSANLNNVNNIIDRTGDIKLEWNGEYRYDLVQMFSGAINLKGAVFVDAGNIWLAKADSNYRGGEFGFGKLGRDLAVSGGTGIRFDIAGFFIVRFDVATPFKRPTYPAYGGWVVDDIFGYKGWARQNLVYNFAINYPF